jgi:hypothetical protein
MNGCLVLAIALMWAGQLFAATSEPNAPALAKGSEANSPTHRLPGETDAAYGTRAAREKAMRARNREAGAQPPLYGCVLFSDDRPAIVEDANTTVGLSSTTWSLRLAEVQDDGVIEVRLLATEIEQIRSGQMRLIVAVPGSADEDFPIELLTPNKARAGVLKVPRPAGSGAASRPPGAGSPSLVGKPLPGFDGIKPGFDPNQDAGKRLLVCLWDMNQRPSRRMVDELAKRAQSLKAACVEVVLTQISKVDANDLDTWLKARRVPFHAGTATIDEQPLRRRWAFDALPWLILTDPNHTVCAEGFGLEPLDAALKGGNLGTLPARPSQARTPVAAAPAAGPQVQDPNGQEKR